MCAKKLLTKAMSCEKDGCKLVAHQLYLQGIQELEKVFEDYGTLPSIYHSHFDEIKHHYVKLDKLIIQRSRNGASIEEIFIDKNATGYSYQRIFGKYLDTRVQEVLVYESYIRQKHQFRNLINFLELLRRNCPQLKYVHVVTKQNQNNCTTDTSLNTEELLEKIKFILQTQHSISFTYSFEGDLHDRGIFLGYGIRIKLTRGLDIYQPPDESQFRSNDFDLRKCVANNIHIFHCESFA